MMTETQSTCYENDQFPQEFDPETTDDNEFEAWLQSLNENHSETGASRPPVSLFTRLLFHFKHGYSIDKIGFLSREEQLKESYRLESTAHERQLAKIRFIRRQARLHRGSLFGIFAIGLFALLLFALLILYTLLCPSPVVAQSGVTLTPDIFHGKKGCPTLNGKPMCNLNENDRSLSPKPPKHGKLICVETDKFEGPEGCMPPSFFVDSDGKPRDTGTDSEGVPLYPVCHHVLKCRPLR